MTSSFASDRRRAAAPATVLVVLLVAAVPAPSAGAVPDATGVDVDPTDEAIRVDAPGYRAVVDRPFGNLANVTNAAGERLVGTGGPMVDGVVVRWPGARQQDGGGMAEPEIAVDGTRVTVRHARFEETYRFRPDRILVEVTATGGPEASPLSVEAGSVLEPSRNASRRFVGDAYDRLGAYPTDITTDRSGGQFGLWPTSTSTVGNAHTYRPYMIEPVLEGRCLWYTQRGTVRFGRLPIQDVENPAYGERCFVANQTDAEAEGQVVRDATHQVVQSFDGLRQGDTLAFSLSVGADGYEALEVPYPASTRVPDHHGNATAKLLVPRQTPPDGHGLVIFHPGHWDDKYRHSYLWDFMANHGFIVATPWTTADMGEVHPRHDWGYMEQIEFADLRRWVMDRYDVDADRVHSVGLSLGGLNALLDAVNHPNAYATTVWYDGIYDFRRFWLGSAFGAASTATGIEIGACCGTPPLDAAEEYAWSIRDPKRRIDQLRSELFLVQGAGDAVAPSDHAVELHRDVPGSRLHLAATTHDDNTFAAYRKEARDLMLETERPPEQRDLLDATLYGRPSRLPGGYEPMPDRLDWSTSWIRVRVPDETFTHVRAERRPDGLTVRADRPVQVAARAPADCPDPCAARIGDRTVPVVDDPGFASGRAAVFEVEPGTLERVRFGPAPEGASPAGGSSIPVPGAAAVVALAVAWTIRRRGMRR